MTYKKLLFVCMGKNLINLLMRCPWLCGSFPHSHGQITKFVGKSCACGIEIDAPTIRAIEKGTATAAAIQIESWFNLQCSTSSKWLTTQGWNKKCGQNWVRVFEMVAKLGSSHKGNHINWAISMDQRLTHQCCPFS